MHLIPLNGKLPVTLNVMGLRKTGRFSGGAQLLCPGGAWGRSALCSPVSEWKAARPAGGRRGSRSSPLLPRRAPHTGAGRPGRSETSAKPPLALLLTFEFIGVFPALDFLTAFILR